MSIKVMRSIRFKRYVLDLAEGVGSDAGRCVLRAIRTHTGATKTNQKGDHQERENLILEISCKPTNCDLTS